MLTPQPWPTGGDYSDTIQNPHLCFRDAQLKSGIVTTNKLGLPLGFDGNVAIVFRLESNTDAYAIKCFKKSVADREQRYTALSKYLSGLNLPSPTSFRYMPDEMRVGAIWYPIVRMEWAEARQLDQYVQDALSRGADLAALAEQVRAVMGDLTRYQIAHGDLQHGNLLVDSQGKVRLVDYDGVYVPTLQNLPSDESGHRNYQHPDRYQNGYYHANADSFSALVIYLSLHALQHDPSLWGKFYNGDNLVLEAEDFKNPGITPIWNCLKSNPDALVRNLADKLEIYCRGPVASVPALEDLLAGAAFSSSPSLPPAQPAASLSSTITPWYLQTNTTSTPPPQTTNPQTTHNVPVPATTPISSATPTQSPNMAVHVGEWEDSQGIRFLLKTAVVLILAAAIALFVLRQLHHHFANSSPVTPKNGVKTPSSR